MPAGLDPFVRAVATHPTTPTLWLAATYNPFIFGSAYIHRTDDAGATWDTVTPETTVVDSFAFDPDDPARIYACAWSGFLRSDDAGMNWSYIAPNGCGDLVMHPHTTTIMYAAGSDSVLKTENKGITWTNVLTVEQNVRAVAIDPTVQKFVYAATPDTVFRSTNAGCSWQSVNLPIGAVPLLHVEDLAVGRSGMLYVATNHGVWAVSFD